MDDPRFVSATPEEIREALRKMKEAAMPEPIDHTAEARAEAEAELEWFDSIHGDREGGRVMLRYDVVTALLAASRRAESERKAQEAEASNREREAEQIRSLFAASRREPSEPHDRDRMGICRRCGQGLTATQIIDGEQPCRAPEPEPSATDEREWEYGWNTGSTVSLVGTREQAEEALTIRQALGGVGTGDWGSRFMRRRKAGPWEVVPDPE